MERGIKTRRHQAIKAPRHRGRRVSAQRVLKVVALKAGALCPWLLAVGLLVSGAHGERVRGIGTTSVQPIAVRGGVLMLPLRAERAGDRWPVTMTIRLADGRKVAGNVGWIGSRGPVTERRWTDEPRGLAIRAIQNEDDSSSGLGRPVLLARLPDDGEGVIRFGAQTLEARWVATPLPPEVDDVPQVMINSGLDQPDASSPFAYWRWALAARAAAMPPPPRERYGEIGRMLAEHEASIWWSALDRLESFSPGVADEVLATLTRTCRDRGVRFAAWESDPEQTALLLAILLDDSKADRSRAIDALSWAERRPPVLIWRMGQQGDEVTIAIANPQPRELVAQLRWRGAVEETPLAAVLHAGEVARVTLERPPRVETRFLAGKQPPALETDVLEVRIEGREFRVLGGARVSFAAPPGAFVHRLSAPLRLVELQTGLRRDVEERFATDVQLRRLAGRWELFFS